MSSSRHLVRSCRSSEFVYSSDEDEDDSLLSSPEREPNIPGAERDPPVPVSLILL
jgi:hypothetical protein